MPWAFLRAVPWSGTGPAVAACLLAASALLLLSGCQRTESTQGGFRGTGMLQLEQSRKGATATGGNAHGIPEPEPSEDPDPEAPAIKEVFKNVQVLNDLTVLEFSRLMQALSTWIAPDEGCDFCHNPDKLESDEKYPKVVARRMIQMTRDLNTKWKKHVGDTGVTCWTCHRGQAVPTGDWFKSPVQGLREGSLIGWSGAQNRAGMGTVANAALPYDPLSEYLVNDVQIRIQGTEALAQARHHPVKSAEWTYSLMLYMSQSLGVNCGFCHNTRALASWNESSPQRSTAWYGIRMVREINTDYLIPLKPTFPANRLSPEGDGPKVACMTCHKGISKPMHGVTMLNDYPELRGVITDRPALDSPNGAASAPKR